MVQTRLIALAVVLTVSMGTTMAAQAGSVAPTRTAHAEAGPGPAPATLAVSETFSSPLAAVRELVEADAGPVLGVNDADVSSGAADSARAYLSSWTFEVAGGQRQAGVISSRVAPDAPVSLIVLLVETAADGEFRSFLLREDRASERFVLQATGPGNVVCKLGVGAAANSGLKKIIDSAARRTLYGVVLGIFIEGMCGGPAPGTQFKGATWSNGLFADTYGPYTAGDPVGALEDVVVRPYSCIGGTPGLSVPCQGLVGSGVGTINVRIQQATVWPDGVIQDRTYTCDRTSCAQPQYQYEFVADAGRYAMGVYTEEAAPGSLIGFIPSGGIRRSFIVV